MLNSNSLAEILEDILAYLKELFNISESDSSVFTMLWETLRQLIQSIMNEDI